jgi:hypothetical protein
MTHETTTRPIKFRAWDGERETMLYMWHVNGQVGRVDTLEFADNGEWQMGQRHYDEIIGAKSYNKGSALMQFAGFKDKNGVDVYEDDIVEAWSEGSKGVFRIKWRQGGAPIWLLYPNGQHRQMWNIHCSECGPDKQFISLAGKVYTDARTGYYDDGLTVIGNIHEHPELLTPPLP